jgi:outer membrane lipoprotein-sorting protein
MNRRQFAALAAAIAIAATTAYAETPEEILAKLEANQVFATASIEATLTVSSTFGTTVNGLRTWSRKGGDTLIEILTGPDKGQKILRQGDNVYLYYPDAEEVIWLKGSALKDAMMGSDFSYEDLTNDRALVERFSATLIGEEEIDGVACHRLVLVAKRKTEPYPKEELWVDSKLYVTRKAILYSASGKALRELSAQNVRAIDGKRVAFTTLMRDLLKKNTSTEMRITKAEIGLPIPASKFNREDLSW